MEKTTKKYYWLKLEVDFFDREEIKLIESMPKGRDYIVFYMKLLLKGANSEGKLMFKDIIPYTDEMLASITNTDIDTVRTAVKLFVQLGMMEKLDNGALFMLAVQNMVGSETEYARKKREYREKEKKKLEQLNYKESVEKLTENSGQDIYKTDTDIQRDIFQKEQDNFLNVLDNIKTKKDNVRQEKELEKEIDIYTTAKIDILDKKEPEDSSSNFEKIKILLEQHGISAGTTKNIIQLMKNKNIKLEYLSEVLKIAPIKNWNEGAVYTALRDDWLKNIKKQTDFKARSEKIDKEVQAERIKIEQQQAKVEEEKKIKLELLDFLASLNPAIQEKLRTKAEEVAKVKFGATWRSMVNSLVIYKIIREYKNGTLEI